MANGYVFEIRKFWNKQHWCTRAQGSLVFHQVWDSQMNHRCLVFDVGTTHTAHTAIDTIFGYELGIIRSICGFTIVANATIRNNVLLSNSLDWFSCVVWILEMEIIEQTRRNGIRFVVIRMNSRFTLFAVYNMDLTIISVHKWQCKSS